MRITSGGFCLLDLWLRGLLVGNQAAQDAHRDTNQSGPQPDLLEILVPNGAHLPAASREVFVAHALWRFQSGTAGDAPAELLHASTQTMEIIYA